MSDSAVPVAAVGCAAPPEVDEAALAYRRARREHWDEVARRGLPRSLPARTYQRRLQELARHLVPPGRRVLEVGCGEGDLLAALEPAAGVGVDFAPAMLGRAAERHPDPALRWVEADAHQLALDESFDAIVLSDLVNDLWDVQTVFQRLREMSRADTRVVLNFYSLLWRGPLNAARGSGLARPLLPQNWLTVDDVTNLLELADFEVVRRSEEVLLPLPALGLDRLANRWLVRLWPFRLLAMTHLLVARPRPRPEGLPRAGTGATGASAARPSAPVVSVLVPARNEAGNISSILRRVPEMGAGTELVFVEGHSQDDTYGAIERALRAEPGRRAQLLRQSGKGKGDAVRTGFAAARGDVLMILDADLTVPPEDLPRFYQALVDGKGELINGVRLVYPMEERAMRFFNLLANKFFSLAFSWLLGQPIKDTLCGTKVMWRADYERLAAQRAYFGDFDPFGDFDLLFGAARLNLKIVDLPIRYRERTYGTTNIQRWRHGLLLLRMVLFAARRIKFV